MDRQIIYSRVTIRCNSNREVEFNPKDYNESILIDRLEKQGETIKEIFREE
jgi:hypothetical protein